VFGSATRKFFPKVAPASKPAVLGASRPPEFSNSPVACLADSGLLLLFRCLVGDLEIILHTEDSRDRVGADTGCVLVRLRIHDALQFHMPILHRDADRLGRVNRVLVQGWIAVHRARYSQQRLVIHDRDRIDFDVRCDLFYAGVS